jgi:aryl-alcohol dehydrogenase-like predicted oxidoreductase
MNIPLRTLGKTGVNVTVIGLGGEGILRTYGHDREAYELINRALDLGINYCESATGCASVITSYSLLRQYFL